MKPDEFNGLATTNSGGDLQSVPDSPLAAGEGGDVAVAPLGDLEETKRLNSGLIILVAVVLIAFAGLFSMRRLAQVAGETGIPAEIENTINGFLAAMDGGPDGTDGIGGQFVAQDINPLAVLTAAYHERQIPLEDVARDPFALEKVDQVLPETPINTADPGAQARAQLAAKRKTYTSDFDRARGRLRLKAVMGGSSPLAIIDDRTVHLGDTITPEGSGITFTVVKIERGAVDLTSRSDALDLTLTCTLMISR